MQNFGKQSKNAWEFFSKNYIDTMESQTFAFFVMLANTLKLHEAKNILEVGAGSGFTVKYAKSVISKDCHYTISDFSEEMVKTSFHRMCAIANIEKALPENFESIKEFPELNVSLVQADNMDLHMFPNSTFDRYISVLSLMLVEDPVKQLQEAFRVTKSGGIVGFTVVGRKENATLLSTLPKVYTEMGLNLPNERTPFHLNDREKLIQMVKDAGFANIKSWFSIVPMNHSEEELIKFYDTQPMARKLRSNLSKEQNEEMTKRILEIAKKNEEENKVFQFEGLNIVAFKP